MSSDQRFNKVVDQNILIYQINRIIHLQKESIIILQSQVLLHATNWPRNDTYSTYSVICMINAYYKNMLIMSSIQIKHNRPYNYRNIIHPINRTIIRLQIESIIIIRSQVLLHATDWPRIDTYSVICMINAYYKYMLIMSSIQIIHNRPYNYRNIIL